MCCCFKTKVATDIHSVVREVWGHCRCAWDWVPLAGASGGLISIWKEDVLKVEAILHAQRALAVKVHGLVTVSLGPLQMSMGLMLWLRDPLFWIC